MTTSMPINNKRFQWTALTCAVLLVILYFGLRPKDLRMDNPVAVLPEKGAIAMGDYGFAFVDDFSSFTNAGPIDALTIELAVASTNDNGRNFGSLLTVHDGSDQRQLFIGQWKSWLVVMNGDDYAHKRNRPRLSLKDALPPHQRRMITITAEQGSTRLYIDGELAASNTKWQLAMPGEGAKVHLVMGNSVTGKNSWAGEFYGLAIYAVALSEQTVQRHFIDWKQRRRFPFEPNDPKAAVYSMDIVRDRLVPDQSGRHPAMRIPDAPLVLKKNYLATHWPKDRLDRYFLFDAALNFIGFMPLGASLIGWLCAFQARPGRRRVILAMASCGLLSLAIEIVQAWMPTRSSSMLDLLMNTAGAWVGMGVLAGFFRMRGGAARSTRG